MLESLAMNIATAMTPCRRVDRNPPGHVFADLVPLATMLAATGGFAVVFPRWLSAIGVALSLFYGLKLLSLRDTWRTATVPRLSAYLLLWPGMNSRTFLRPDSSLTANRCPTVLELAFALTKLAGGLALVVWARTHAFTAPARWVGAIGMVGLIFTFHFGIFHVLSWLWRRHGIDAPPLMRAPIAACSLAEFWGECWNTAFAALARRFLLRPLARRWNARTAGAFVFLVSGIVHELALSLPARGGWGGPTAYFLFQALGTGIEKSRVGRVIGLGSGWRGWLWTLFVTVAPIALLFHAAFLDRVVVPLFRLEVP
jgi:hypothetical protein